jgi:O-antigen ligase
VDVERAYPLEDDIGRPLPGGGEPEIERSLFGASGRTEAWRGAIGRAAERPLLGFGFGTEARAFVDRYYAFVGGRPENSYIGIAIQLGSVGLAALLALLAVLVVGGRGSPAGLGSACAGVVAAGLAVAVVQSYLYAAGNIAAATFWIAAFLLPALGAPRKTPPA